MDTPAKRSCPVCNHTNPENADVCQYCGAILDTLLQPNKTTVPLQNTTTALKDSEVQLGKLESSLIPHTGIAIYLMGDSKPIAVLQGNEIVLGRQTSEGPSNIFDLSPFGAFEMGVSRQHVLVRKLKGGYEIIDLNSTNGTWLNDSQLVPNRPYPVQSDIQLRIGKMALFLVLARSEGS